MQPERWGKEPPVSLVSAKLSIFHEDPRALATGSLLNLSAKQISRLGGALTLCELGNGAPTVAVWPALSSGDWMGAWGGKGGILALAFDALGSRSVPYIVGSWANHLTSLTCLIHIYIGSN